MAFIKSFNNQSLGEEIANGVSHCVGTLLSIAGTVIVIVRACFYSNALGIVSAALYGSSLILLYCLSTLYHSITNEKAKRVFQIFDHCCIFLLIFGTDIPVSLVLIGTLAGKTALGWIIFGVSAFCTVLGITLTAINLNKFDKLLMILYVLMGWMVVLTIKYIWHVTGIGGMVYLVTGGVLYTLGIIFYKMKNIKYMHFIWHIFVLAGSILHYFFVLFYCYPAM